jgi:hypothetical protein
VTVKQPPLDLAGGEGLGDQAFAVRRCTKCAIVKPFAEFQLNRANRNRKTRRNSWCKDCLNAHNRERYANLGPEERNEYLFDRRVRHYFVDDGRFNPQKFASMMQAQKYLCALCNEPFADVGLKPLHALAIHIDHDHDTGKVRGLLHRRCNLGLAYIEQSGYVELAMAYLKDQKGRDGAVVTFVKKE